MISPLCTEFRKARIKSEFAIETFTTDCAWNYWKRLFLGTGLRRRKAGPAAFLSLTWRFNCIMRNVLPRELAVAVPVSSSFVTYANDYISPAWACGVGWSYWVTWVSYVPSEMIAAGIIHRITSFQL